MMYTPLTHIAAFVAGSVVTALLAARHDNKDTSGASPDDKDERIRNLEQRLVDGGECILKLTARINEMQSAHQTTVTRLENDKIFLAESCEKEVAALKEELKANKHANYIACKRHVESYREVCAEKEKLEGELKAAKEALASHGIEPAQTEPSQPSAPKPESTTKAILRVFAEFPGKWITTRQLATMTERPVANVKSSIARLFNKHVVVRRKRYGNCLYTLNPQQPTQPAKS